jgi:hypothetical protein
VRKLLFVLLCSLTALGQMNQSGGSGGKSAGSNTQVQYNDNGVLGIVPAGDFLTYNKTSHIFYHGTDPSAFTSFASFPARVEIGVKDDSVNGDIALNIQSLDTDGSGASVNAPVGITTTARTTNTATAAFPTAIIANAITAALNDDAQALALTATDQGSQNIDALIGLGVALGHNSSGTLSKAIGMYITPISNAGTIDAATGIDIDNIGSANASTSYALHIEDQGATSYAVKVDGGKSTFTGIQLGVRTVTANDPATLNDFTIRCDATAGNVTETMLASPPAGAIINVKKVDASANTCIIAGNGHNIDGSASLTISTQNVNKQIQYDSTSGTWNVL